MTNSDTKIGDLLKDPSLGCFIYLRIPPLAAFFVNVRLAGSLPDSRPRKRNARGRFVWTNKNVKGEEKRDEVRLIIL